MRSTEVAEPGDFAMDNQLPRLGYRRRYRIELVLQARLKESAVLQNGKRVMCGLWIIGPDHLDL